MATHSSVPAWRIPGTGDPGGLPSMGSHTARRDKRLGGSSRRYTYRQVLSGRLCSALAATSSRG